MCLAGLIIFALLLVLCGGKIGETLAAHSALSSLFTLAWKILVWPLSFVGMFLSFSIIYYFGPDLDQRKWYWVTPGAVLGVALWLIGSLGFRIYLRYFDSYSATYGSVGAVIILMAWLYITGLAVLIGAEVNWIIENEEKGNVFFDDRRIAITCFATAIRSGLACRRRRADEIGRR